MGLANSGLRGSLRNLSTGVGALPGSGVARWNFEQNLTDSWNGYDLTEQAGSAYSTTAQYGSYSRNYDGTDDYDTGPAISEVEGVTEMSIAAWMYPRDLTEFQLVLKKTGGPDNGLWGFHLNDSGQARFKMTDDSGNGTSIAGSTLTSAAWTLVTGTFNSGSMTLYYNDTQEGTASLAGSNVDSASNQLKFGGQNPGGYNYYDGLLDRTDIYSKELSSTEVSNLYSTGSI